MWVIWPERRQIDVWRPDNIERPAATLGIDDALNGDKVVPGFMLSAASIFAAPLG